MTLIDSKFFNGTESHSFSATAELFVFLVNNTLFFLLHIFVLLYKLWWLLIFLCFSVINAPPSWSCWTNAAFHCWFTGHPKPCSSVTTCAYFLLKKLFVEMARDVYRMLFPAAKRRGRNFDVLWRIFQTCTTTLAARFELSQRIE